MSNGWKESRKELQEKKKTDRKSRYFAMFESTFKKCLIQLNFTHDSDEFILIIRNVGLIQLSAEVESNIFRKLIQTS